MPKRPSKQRERRYVAEYVGMKFPDRKAVFYNCAIGSPPESLARAHPEVSLRHFKKWRMYADAVVVMQDRLIVIETKLRKPDRGIGALIMYRPQIKHTPELAPYINLPLEMRLVTPRPDPRVITAAAANDIVVDVWAPEWALAYLRELGLA